MNHEFIISRGHAHMVFLVGNHWWMALVLSWEIHCIWIKLAGFSLAGISCLLFKHNSLGQWSRIWPINQGVWIRGWNRPYSLFCMGSSFPRIWPFSSVGGWVAARCQRPAVFRTEPMPNKSRHSAGWNKQDPKWKTNSSRTGKTNTMYGLHWFTLVYIGLLDFTRL